MQKWVQEEGEQEEEKDGWKRLRENREWERTRLSRKSVFSREHHLYVVDVGVATLRQFVRL